MALREAVSFHPQNNAPVIFQQEILRNLVRVISGS